MKFNIIRILLITCLLSSQVGIWAQTKSITGTVCDTNGEMIIGANVTVKGTTKGTIYYQCLWYLYCECYSERYN